MKMTDAQRQVVDSTGNIKINAVAGSGKTSTLVEYAKSRPSEKILYLGFNRSVKDEASKRFNELGLDHVYCMTAHSLAYRDVVYKNKYTVRPTNLRAHEINELLGDESTPDTLRHAYHVKELVSSFCNSDHPVLLDYIEASGSAVAGKIVDDTSKILTLMNRGRIPVTHDFYLKKYHLSRPDLSLYDAILFDEAQDASPVMLDVVLAQRARKIVVGHVNQQIYSWLGATKYLERVDFKNFDLWESFRFPQQIADLANIILSYKTELGLTDQVPALRGLGEPVEAGKIGNAILSRTNVFLLSEAVRVFSETSSSHGFYFEGNFNNYAYATEGCSLYDVLALYNRNHAYIRDPLIKSFPTFDDLVDFATECKDGELKMFITIVRRYGGDLYRLLKGIKERIVEDKNRADTIFSTMHKAKGMEYHHVELTPDFFNRSAYLEAVNGMTEMTPMQLTEEINLLYVAITRAKNLLKIPEGLSPSGFGDTEGEYVRIIEE